MKTLNLAVIGKDVSQSESPEMHSFIAQSMGNCINYKKISIPEEQFESSFENAVAGLDGFNVTIPYKLTVIPYLKSVTGDAIAFGAVNTVKTEGMAGTNTDGLGFSLMLKSNGVEINGKTVLVLGAGGAGRSAAKKLLDGGAKVSVYDVRYENCVALAKEFDGIVPLKNLTAVPYDVIINATGIGMHNTQGKSPVGEEILNGCTVAVDLIYVPKKSRFLEIAESLGKKIINGQAMLFYQAYYAECFYFGCRADEAEAKRLFESYLTVKEK